MNRHIFDKIRHFYIRGVRPEQPVIIRIYVEGMWFEVPISTEELSLIVDRGERYYEMKVEKERAERAERLRREDQQRTRFDPFGQSTNYHFWATGDGRSFFEQFFREGMPQPGQQYTFRMPGQGVPPKTEYGGPKVVQPPRERLAEIAGCIGVEISDKKLLRRAQRAAHPDTGGSHELFIEVEKLAKYLKL